MGYERDRDLSAPDDVVTDSTTEPTTDDTQAGADAAESESDDGDTRTADDSARGL